MLAELRERPGEGVLSRRGDRFGPHKNLIVFPLDFPVYQLLSFLLGIVFWRVLLSNFSFAFISQLPLCLPALWCLLSPDLHAYRLPLLPRPLAAVPHEQH